jgi:hypothetical protein
MDLSVFKCRFAGSWRANKRAALACFVVTGAILAATLVEQNGLADEMAALARRLF